jgi:hypothetical protein
MVSAPDGYTTSFHFLAQGHKPAMEKLKGEEGKISKG